MTGLLSVIFGAISIFVLGASCSDPWAGSWA